jgi:hypothetical protein
MGRGRAEAAVDNGDSESITGSLSKAVEELDISGSAASFPQHNDERRVSPT